MNTIKKSTPEQLERARLYRESHKDHYRQYFKEYHKKNRQKQIDKAKRWRDKNWEVCAIKRKRDRKARPEFWKDVSRRYRQEAFMNPHLRLRHNLAIRVARTLKSKKTRSDNRTIKILGADIVTVRRYVESLWKPGMTWDNWGRYGWHLDHARPCASFDLSDPDQVAQCFHYTNLQPLWAAENYRKRSNYKGRNHFAPRL